MVDAGATSKLIFVFFLYRDLAIRAVEESQVNNITRAKMSVSQIGRITATT